MSATSLAAISPRTPARADLRRRRGSPRLRAQGGFTLIEVLISLAILSFMMTIGWSTINTSARAKKNFEAFSERNHEIRIALARAVKDISQAYLSANEDQNLQDRRTVFIGKSSGSVAELRFSSFGHSLLWADANESEQTLISFSGGPDLEDRSKTNWLRRENRRLSNETWESEPGDVDVMIHDVEKVEIEFFDWRENAWKSRWDSTAADGERGQLPTRVKITVTVRNGDREEAKYVTQARIGMEEELRFFAN